MGIGIAPKERFGGWDDYFQTLREVDRLVDSGALTPVAVEGPAAAYSDLYYFEDREGARWALSEPEPPAAGSWGPAEGFEYGGEEWSIPVKAPEPVRFFRSWGSYLKFLVWVEKMIAARELVADDPDADRQSLAAAGSVHRFVYRDGTAWELRVPDFGEDDYGSFTQAP